MRDDWSIGVAANLLIENLDDLLRQSPLAVLRAVAGHSQEDIVFFVLCERREVGRDASRLLLFGKRELLGFIGHHSPTELLEGRMADVLTA